MTTVRVYKTNVDDRTIAQTILDTIHQQFSESNASFDLEDCDKVLRIVALPDSFEEAELRDIMDKYGCTIETLI